ncbi:MAG: T9SS type A sorting domain-containing protein, partial [Rhodothermales bacterium]|nr:T9SS type A sorting domain-containing protein [Rhodothermales bacterium]
TFDADEESCRAGVAGSDWGGRAGDYSATNVDPDRDTFWHTNEYGRSSTFRGWGTAVCEFSIQSGPVNDSPVVAITAPADGSSFATGSSVSFAGTATDTEDGVISANLAWSSSLDGSIGSGASFSTSTLSVGVHTVTASVTDSGGKSGSDQISVTITPPPGADLHVESISTGTIAVNGRRVRGSATVTIVDNNGTPIAGATVSGDFSGSITESATNGVTNGSGQITLTTSGTTKSRNPSIDFCVSGVTGGGLPYDPNDNAPGTTCGAPPGGDPTSITVAGVSTGQQGVGGGNKRGTASVTIVDDLGNSYQGATVTGDFSGDFNENGKTAVSNGSGVASFATTGTKKGKVNVDFCVSNVVGGLPYVPNPSFTCGNINASKDLAASLSLEQAAYTFELGQNYPNPFTGTTSIGFSLAEQTHASLRVYNLLGQEVATLADGQYNEGRHVVTFDTSDLSSGLYIYVYKAGSFTSTKNMTVMN